ncbi:methionine--tRNA ligase [Bacillus infantis]|uniref:methionine--tRNA ligase n=1 Tax=Bacillus infantis TaxID=324767 RepID=UPI003CF1499C
MAIFIGGAWPYANGSLHLGHISSLLPGDILARYYRMKGEEVLYVSGSDCNGTPIAIRAKNEGKSAKEIADRYHSEFAASFEQLGFTYDLYTRTDALHHHQTVQEVFLSLLENGHLFPRTIEQSYCRTCVQFLPDRYVEGICPSCGSHARGDQCDACSAILEPADLLEKSCKICGTPPEMKETEHYYFRLSHFQRQLEELSEKARSRHLWRDNSCSLTRRYLTEGLQDRAATRDLDVGVPVPVEGMEKKKIYVWIEAVIGYLSASREWARQQGKDGSRFGESDVVSYYVHGKDNIPFHTIIWPAIQMGIGLPGESARMISSEYLTLEKKKLSTSRNYAVWVPDILERYEPDSIRYFLAVNAPENRDADFSWREFIYSHNSELLGAYGNLVNRTFKFIEKYYDSMIPEGKLSEAVQEDIKHLYNSSGEKIEDAKLKEALEEIFAFVRSANKYFDSEQPWKTIKSDPQKCADALQSCVYIIKNLARLLNPFLPFSSRKINNMLQDNTHTLEWKEAGVAEKRLGTIAPLFSRIEEGRISEELDRLEAVLRTSC